MERLGILKDRLRALVRRDAVIEEIDEEMRFHVEMETQTNLERGMRPEEARAAALRSFGNLDRMKDLAYEIRGGRILDRFWEDIRYSLRRLLENPTSTCAAALVIALGIGPNTAMFSVIYGVFFAGWTESSRLVVLWAKPRDNSIEWRGAADGVGCAWLAARLMQRALYGADSPSLATMAVVGAALLGAALVTCLIPARRAARVQPMVALRDE